MSYDAMQDPTQQPSEPTHNDGQDDGSFDVDPAFVSDGKKPVNRNMMLMGGIMIVGLFVVWFMYFRGSPSAAQAGVSDAAGEQIKQFLDNDNVNVMKQTLKETQQVVDQFRQTRSQVPLQSLKSNPFRDGAPKNDTPVVQHEDDGNEADRIKHANADHELAALHLQSIVRGGKYRACMINNTLYREGQQVGIFTVKKVTAHGVIVVYSKWQWELKMPS